MKYIKSIRIFLLVLIIIGLGLLVTQNMWVPKVVKMILSQENATPQLIGGDKDAHSCLGSAGYSWCEVKNKCLRVWEEKCEVPDTGYSKYLNKNYGYTFLCSRNCVTKGSDSYLMVKDSASSTDDQIIVIESTKNESWIQYEGSEDSFLKMANQSKTFCEIDSPVNPGGPTDIYSQTKKINSHGLTYYESYYKDERYESQNGKKYYLGIIGPIYVFNVNSQSQGKVGVINVYNFDSCHPTTSPKIPSDSLLNVVKSLSF